MIQPSDSGRWAELCAAFDTLVELDAAARAERLAAIGAADPAARLALEELLEADAKPASALRHLDAIFGASNPPSAAADSDMLNLVGRTLAHFRIVEPIAAGGMGVVYRALDTHLTRPVALKFPLPGQRLDGQVRERFLREARAAAALDHPNICSIYEAGESEDGRLFLAMPLYEGETLKARIGRAGPLPISDALAIAAQTARGLHAAHRAGIVHRDLKPANVIILPDDAVKILDFGVAWVGDVTLTKSHDTLGTVSYMAPEQVRGERVDGRADLWALGVVLYEMLTGRRPFQGEHEIAIAHAIVHSNPIPPSVSRPEIWPELNALVLGLLARQPDRRPALAEIVATVLTALQTRSAAAPPARRWRLPLARSSRRPLMWATVFTLIATGAGATAWLLRPGAAGGSAEPRLVSILPFGDPALRDDPDYLAFALPDEIATRLSRLKAVAIPGQQSAPGAGLFTLPAGAVVRGSVRRTGDEVLLQVDLFDAKQQRRVWSREYRGPLNTLMALQQNATEGIVGALRLHLAPGERALLRQVPTGSAEAYDLYLRGRAEQIEAASRDSAQQVAGLQRAQAYYVRARESDPAFAAPRARLAQAHLALAQYDRTSARRDQARLEAEAALRIQPGMPEAHDALASYWLLRGEEEPAIVELERALAGSPNVPHLHSLLATNLRRVGRWDEAVTAFERASRLQPDDTRLHLNAALTYSRMRRYEEAITHWNRVIALDSTRDPFPQIIRGFNYLRLGNVDSLDAAISRIPLGRDSGGMAAAGVGMTTYARYTAHRIMRRYPEALASLDSARFAICSDRLLFVPVSLMRAQTLERMGDSARAQASYEAARKLLEDSVTAQPRDARIHIALGLAYAGLHRRADAMREARTATDLVPMSHGESSDGPTAFMGGAVEIYAQLGEADAAFQLLELLFTMPAGRETSVPLLRLDPVYDRLHSDPRFDALVERFSRN